LSDNKKYLCHKCGSELKYDDFLSIYFCKSCETSFDKNEIESPTYSGLINPVEYKK